MLYGMVVDAEPTVENPIKTNPGKIAELLTDVNYFFENIL
jgi:hypothetical protein